MRPIRNHAVDVRALVDFRAGRRRSKLPVETRIARAVIRDAAGGIQLNGFEWPEERPAQAEAVFHGVIEIFRGNVSFADEAKSLREQRALRRFRTKPSISRLIVTGT